MQYPKRVGQKIQEYGDKCHYCSEALHRENFSIDHVVPISGKGKDHRDNMVACCVECNRLKNNLTLEEFRPLFFLRTGYRNFDFELALICQIPVPEDQRQIVMKEVKMDGSIDIDHL